MPCRRGSGKNFRPLSHTPIPLASNGGPMRRIHVRVWGAGPRRVERAHPAQVSL
jgi:hypothetical protein